MKYFDHAATTLPYEDVTNTVAEIMAQHYGNPSSLHKLGEATSKLLSKSREVCAKALDVNPGEIVFTSGATESNNLAIKGAALQYRSRGQHMITTATEHPSVFECCKQLEQLGWQVTYLPVDTEGKVSVDEVLAAIRKDTVLVSIMHVNNETGCIQPVEDIGQMLKKHYPRIIFHVDGVQGFSTQPLSLDQSGIDLYSLSAHKLRGPKGIGLLYIRDGITLFPLIVGGGQEWGRRSGTENIPLIVGMSKAIRMTSESRKERADQLVRLKIKLMNGIRNIPDLVVNSTETGSPHIVHFSFPGMKSEAMLHMLEEAGYLVSTKSACSSKLSEPSRILLAMGKDQDVALSGIRISLGEEHTEKDIEELLAVLDLTVRKLRNLKGRGN
ncbi:Cysteine desulfurase [compost metagenome]